MPRPFLVLATQNPVELEGTFPLPEAQLDRFLLRLTLGYPGVEEETAILRPSAPALPWRAPSRCWSRRPAALQAVCRGVHVGEAVEGYLVGLVRATRGHEALDLGASPRASLALYPRPRRPWRPSGAAPTLLPDDVKHLAPAVLGHRLIPTAQSRLRGRGAPAVVEALLSQLPLRWRTKSHVRSPKSQVSGRPSMTDVGPGRGT